MIPLTGGRNLYHVSDDLNKIDHLGFFLGETLKSDFGSQHLSRGRDPRKLIYPIFLSCRGFRFVNPRR